MTEIIEDKEQGSSRSQPVLSPKSDTAGDWVKWGSGPCPVEPETLVDIRLGASEYEGTPEREMLSVHAKDWGWDWKFTDPDIIAWRLSDGGEAVRSGQLRDEKSPSPIETEQRERVVAAAKKAKATAEAYELDQSLANYGVSEQADIALASIMHPTDAILALEAERSTLQQENERLRDLVERSREELRLIRAKDSDAVYDTTLRVDMSLALQAPQSQGGEDHVG